MALHMLNHPNATQKRKIHKSNRPETKEDNKVLLKVNVPTEKSIVAAIFNCFQFN